jgi:hypothetical protein
VRQSVLAVLLVTAVAPAARADVPVVRNTSVVRVRANNNFGVAKQHDITPTLPMSTSDSIGDVETGTTANAGLSATYQFTLSGTTATFSITTSQNFSVGAQGTLAEGFIHLTLDEPYEYELSGSLMGIGSDAGDGYQQRTFLRQFQSPFTTIFLEDETGFGTSVALAVNQQNSSGGGLYNQSGPRSGLLAPGIYEFNYELEGRDNDVDGAGTGATVGSVTLILRRPGTGLAAPTNFMATTNGLSVVFTWGASPGASSYQLEAGTGSGLSNAFVGDVGNVTTLPAAGPPGTYFARIRAKAGAALSAPSNEANFTLGAPVPCAPPPAPTALTFSKNGSILTLMWTGSTGATVYRLQAGTGSGLANAFDGDVGGGTSQQFNVSGVPAGTYFVRISARNACGASGPSNEVAITLP